MSGITGISSAASTAASEASSSNDLGRDQFLQLLVVQMKYQDPLNPVSNEDFIAQLAQFSTLESMENVERSFQGVEAYSLLGKTIVVEDPLTLQQTSGIVSGVKQKSGNYYAIIPSQATSVTKEDALQAFTQSNLNYNSYKDKLFLKGSLTTDTLLWNSSITNPEDFATVMGFSTPAALPEPLIDLWNSNFYQEFAIDNITEVYQN